MSVRIYELSKDIGIDNAELLNLLRDRGYQVRSASSTIDNISAESLRQEFGQRAQAAPTAVADSPAGGETPAPVGAEPTDAPVLRTKEDVERERREREEEDKRNAARTAAPAAPPPTKPVPVGPPLKAPPPLPRAPAPMARPPEAPRPPQAAPAAAGAPASPAPLRAPQVGNPGVGPARPPAPPLAPISRPAAAASPSAPPVAPSVRPPQGGPPPRSVVAPPQRPDGGAPRPAGSPPPGSGGPQAPQATLGLRPPAPAGAPSALRPPQISAPAGAPPSAPRPAPQAPRVSAPPVRSPGGATAAPPSSSTVDGDAENAAPPIPADLRRLVVKAPIIVRDFAVQIGKKPFQVISELMELGIFASMNTGIDEEVAGRIARRHGFALEVKHRGEAQQKKVEEPKPKREVKLEARPPVVCILGHVDHGKTTLLDTIRKTNVVAGEAGGITQHIGAYQVEHNGRKITFIDTPGHAAFSNMRARGANVTDIAVLVVAADDGFMPQTDEALSHARRAGVPVVVAINKIDAPGANIDKVYRQMQERNLSPEEWGGETLSAKVSALKGLNIEGLLEAIVLQAEVTSGIEADPKAEPEGVILEAQKELGLGATASVIVQQGTLSANTALVCGEHYCRVRQIIDDRGNKLKSAGPGTPVVVTGWSGTPDAGDTFIAVKNEREAKRLAEENELERKRLEAAQRADTGQASVDDLFAAIAKTQKKALRVIVKADVFGTAEALTTSLLSIKSDKVSLEVVDTGVGSITKRDVDMAAAADGAAIVAFDVGMDTGVAPIAKHHGITIYQHNIIYELIEQVRDAMADLLEPELRENKIGAAEIRAVFPAGKGLVAGCMVTEGRIAREHLARLMRKGKQVAQSRISTLRRFKDDVSEVRAGFECGIGLGDVSDYQVGDVIDVFEILKIKPAL